MSTATPYSQRFAVIWADCDPNRHMRHSAYADYAAHTRYAFFTHMGFSMDRLQALHIGPILFREELLYRREIHLGDEIEVDVAIIHTRPDYSRWSFRSRIFNRSRGTLAAAVNVDGAWLDLETRKLTVPPIELGQILTHLPQADAEIVW